MLQSPLRSPLNAVVKDVIGHPGNNNARRSDIYKAIFADASPGLSVLIEEAIQTNVSAGVWGVTSGWTAGQLAACRAFQDSAGTIPVYAMEQPLGYIKDNSGRGNHLTQPSNTASRPIVSRRVNLLTATDTLATQSVTTLAASHKLSFSGAGSITLSGAASGVYSAGSHAITTTAGSLTLTVAGSVTSADLRLSSDAIASMPTYQRVTSSSDYDQVGFPAYALFDGLDDWLETGTIDMTGTDEMTAVASVMKLSDAATGMVAEFGPTSVIHGTFYVAAPVTTGTTTVAFTPKGTVNSLLNATGFAAPAKVLLSGQSKISTDMANLRVNGAQAMASSSDLGTGNFSAQKLYIGRRAGTSLPFKGRIYGLTLVGKLLSDSQLLALEAGHRTNGKVY